MQVSWSSPIIGMYNFLSSFANPHLPNSDSLGISSRVEAWLMLVTSFEVTYHPLTSISLYRKGLIVCNIVC
jgi:hypothetical protein